MGHPIVPVFCFGQVRNTNIQWFPSFSTSYFLPFPGIMWMGEDKCLWMVEAKRKIIHSFISSIEVHSPDLLGYKWVSRWFTCLKYKLPEQKNKEGYHMTNDKTVLSAEIPLHHLRTHYLNQWRLRKWDFDKTAYFLLACWTGWLGFILSTYLNVLRRIHVWFFCCFLYTELCLSSFRQ